MGNPVEQAAARAIVTMHKNLGEQLTVDDMARSAMFSKFHFTRIFQRATGVSPGRFLSALRLQRAKQLLVTTRLNVADISMQVGYNSVGTFSSRFSRSVGMSPTTYRRCDGFAEHIPTDPAFHAARSGARVCGWINPAHTRQSGLVFLGLFPERIPQGRPVRCAVLPEPGRFQLDDVPVGTWYLLAQSVAENADTIAGATDGPDRPICVASQGPLTIRKDSTTTVNLQLEPNRIVDPPVLLALLDVRNQAMSSIDGPGLTAMSSGKTPPVARLVPDRRSERHAA